ncbi:MAG: bifunctional DNA-formamidopyrimidine glycosylase/DNA-(apurinic or apyrimidinic site) lyase [Pseudomonadota bacterium]
MPELPEVETTRRGIEPWVAGTRLLDWTVRDARLRWPVDIPERLRNQKIVNVGRRGKYLLLEFAQGSLILHLGMSGSLRILTPDTPPLKHDHVDWRLSNQRILRLNDPRRFGCVVFHGVDAAEPHRLLAGLGPEPLGNEFSATYLHQRSRNKKVAVKNFIMDSKVVVGVGNIYAAEALFMAGIRPAIAARRVSRVAYEVLVNAIRTVLARSVRQGGTTLRDFVGSDGNPGYFKQQLNVYGRQGLPCRVCATPLRGRTIGQRASVYCPKCQTSQSFKPPALP